jgi:hypothetical protein
MNSFTDTFDQMQDYHPKATDSSNIAKTLLPGEKRKGRKKGLHLLDSKSRKARAKAISGARLAIAYAGLDEDGCIVVYILNTKRQLFIVTFKVNCI